MTLTPATQVWTTGMNYPGYLPNPDDVRVFATQEQARLDVADRVEEFASEMLDQEIAAGGIGYLDQASFEADADRPSSIAGAEAENIRHDADGDYSQGAFSVQVDNMTHQPPVFWAQPSTAGDYFHDLSSPEAYELEVEINVAEFARGDLFKPSPLEVAAMRGGPTAAYALPPSMAVPRITGIVQ